MTKLLALIGFPGSGKSTRAARICCDEAWHEVNRDNIRLSLGFVFDPKQEKRVKWERDVMIRNRLNDGLNVVSSDTNLFNRHELEAIAKECGADYEEDWTLFNDVPLERCIKQDLLREHSVGKDVITRIYRDYWERQPKPANEGKPAIICDLDGTLCLKPEGASWYDRDFRLDLANLAVLAALEGMIRGTADLNIILLSGRDEQFRGPTQEWLAKHRVSYDRLYMRPDDDKRNDSIVKKELYMTHVQGKYRILYVLDDRPRVVRMWRSELGLPCFQVAEDIEF